MPPFLVVQGCSSLHRGDQVWTRSPIESLCIQLPNGHRNPQTCQAKGVSESSHAMCQLDQSPQGLLARETTAHLVKASPPSQSSAPPGGGLAPASPPACTSPARRLLATPPLPRRYARAVSGAELRRPPRRRQPTQLRYDGLLVVPPQASQVPPYLSQSCFRLAIRALPRHPGEQ